jgi:hypothetical protein
VLEPLPSLRDSVLISHFTQRFRAGLSSFTPFGTRFYAIRSTEPTQNEYSPDSEAQFLRELVNAGPKARTTRYTNPGIALGTV